MNSNRLMAYLVGRGITLHLENSRLRYRAPAGAMTHELKSLIGKHRLAIIKHLTVEAATIAGREMRPAPVIPWPKEAASFCSRLVPSDLPIPLKLHPWVEVINPAKFLLWLRRDVRRGPDGPRALCGAIQDDLVELQRIVLERDETTAIVAAMFRQVGREAA